jgi:hypothetical protein
MGGRQRSRRRGPAALGVGDRPGNRQQLIEAVLVQGDLQGRPVGVLVVADLELEGGKQPPQGRLGHGLQGHRPGRQHVQQLNRAGVGGLLLHELNPCARRSSDDSRVSPVQVLTP